MADWHPKLWLQFLEGWQHDGVGQDLLDEYVGLHNPLFPHGVHGNAFGHEAKTLRLAIYLSLNRHSLNKVVLSEQAFFQSKQVIEMLK